MCGLILRYCAIAIARFCSLQPDAKHTTAQQAAHAQQPHQPADAATPVSNDAQAASGGADESFDWCSGAQPQANGVQHAEEHGGRRSSISMEDSDAAEAEQEQQPAAGAKPLQPPLANGNGAAAASADDWRHAGGDSNGAATGVADDRRRSRRGDVCFPSNFMPHDSCLCHSRVAAGSCLGPEAGIFAYPRVLESQWLHCWTYP